MHANNKVHVSNKPLFGGGGVGLSSENEFENVFCEGCVCIFTVCFDVTKIICFFFCVFFFVISVETQMLFLYFFPPSWLVCL